MGLLRMNLILGTVTKTRGKSTVSAKKFSVINFRITLARDFYWSPCILCTCKNTAHFRTGIYKCSADPDNLVCEKNWLSDWSNQISFFFFPHNFFWKVQCVMKSTALIGTTYKHFWLYSPYLFVISILAVKVMFLLRNCCWYVNHTVWKI